MELNKHIGLKLEKEPTFIDILLRLKAITILLILLIFLFIYHFISVFCSLLHFILPESSNEIKRLFAARFWDLCIYFLKRNKVKFQITGDDIDTDSAIILSNHVSLADHFVIAYLARNSCTTTTDSSKLENSIVLPRVNFFSWFLVWRVPTWKVLFNMAKCDENWELDESLLDSVFYKVLHSRTPEWLIMFPEVNIFTHENALIQQQQSSKYCLPLLENVLYPRFSGIFNLVSAIQKSNNFKFTKIYDINLLYSRESNNPKNIFITPTLFDIFTSSSPPITVHIFVKTRFLSRLPQKRSKVERYIEHAWVDKDKQLTEQKKRLINDYQISTSNYHIDLETTALNSSY